MTDKTSQYDAIVIGCGFAGAVAARELRRDGWSVLVFEARDRIGGRTWAKPDALLGRTLEMGGTHLDPRTRLAWAEAERYGFKLARSGGWPTAWLVRGRLHHGRLPVAVEELPHLERLVVAIDREAARLDPDRPLAEQDVQDLDISLDEFLDRQALPPATRDIAAGFLQTFGSASSENISALHLLRRIAAAGSMTDFALSPGYHLEAGTTALVAAILEDARLKEAGSGLRLSTPVRAIRQDADGVVATTESGAVRARAAVIAVPSNVLRHIDFTPALSAAKTRLSTEELACVGTKVWAVVKGAPDDFFACGKGGGLDWLECAETLDGGRTLMVGFGSDAEALDVTDRASVQKAVRAFLPAAEVTEICGHDWRHDPYSRETWAVFRPGQISRYEAHLRQPEGRISFAGAHTALRWTGFFDGAIESGFRAAGETGVVLRKEQPAMLNR